MFYGLNEGKKTCYRLEDLFFGNKLLILTAKVFLVDNVTSGRILLKSEEFKPLFLCRM